MTHKDPTAEVQLTVREKRDWKEICLQLLSALLVVVIVAITLIALYYGKQIVVSTTMWLWGWATYLWNTVFFNTIGLPFWWISSEKNVSSLSPGVWTIIFILYCLLLNSRDDRGGAGEMMVISYIMLFVGAFCIRFA